MIPASRFAVVALAAIGCLGASLVLAPARAADADPPPHAEAAHACLNQKERRAEADADKLVPLASAMHAARSRMPGTVVRARLCHGQIAGREGELVYVLTVLAHDGKVARITVDAVKGTLVGER